MSTLLTRLADAGVALAATSNTQPEDLGAGRFAAADFLREIQGLAARFDVLRIDGSDYRHRGLPAPPAPCPAAEVAAFAAAFEGGRARTGSPRCARIWRGCTRRAMGRSSTGGWSPCTAWRRSPTRPWRCGSSRSPTGSTTGRFRSSPRASGWGSCSARSCSPGRIVRSTSGRCRVSRRSPATAPASPPPPERCSRLNPAGCAGCTPASGSTGKIN
nr:AFG1/ZapE family ATPase [Candidatus Frankia alpina]